MNDAERATIIRRGLEKHAAEWGSAQTKHGRENADEEVRALLALTCDNQSERDQYLGEYDNRKKQYAEGED
tara:strand:- start:38 stop:250 length:213 start_codon:yes stop_codon:yes gene_type:complete